MIQHPTHQLNTDVSVTGLISISCPKLPAHFIQHDHRHVFRELVYVDNGAMMVTAEGRSHLLKAGELMILPPNMLHTLQAHDQKPASIILIAFCCDSPMMQTLEEKALRLDQREKQCLSQILWETETGYARPDDTTLHADLQPLEDAPFGCGQMIKNMLELLLILLCRGNTSQNHHHTQAVQQVQEYLHAHYREHITLEMLADQQGISITQLKRIFKEQTGTTIITYLTNFRIGQAKQMIQKGDLNFTEIAVAVGYDNIYYFSTLFKKHTGMTLTEYSKAVHRSPGGGAL